MKKEQKLEFIMVYKIRILILNTCNFPGRLYV